MLGILEICQIYFDAESKTDPIVLVEDKVRIELVELDFEPLGKGGQVHGLILFEEIFGEGVLLDIGMYRLGPGYPGWNLPDGAGHLNALDILPPLHIGMDGGCNLRAFSCLYYVSRLGVREEEKGRFVKHVIDRCGPSSLTVGGGQGHGALLAD